jgi:hypothetical protein
MEVALWGMMVVGGIDWLGGAGGYDYGYSAGSLAQIRARG